MMKLVKFVPALTATLVLAACADNTMNQGVTNVAPAVSVSAVENGQNESFVTQVQTVPTTSKSVVYRCLNKVKVSATYAFEGDKPKAVNLLVGNRAINGLAYDPNEADQVVFRSEKYVWNLDNDFRQTLLKGTAMLTEKGQESDPILAKLCEVDRRETSRLVK